MVTPATPCRALPSASLTASLTSVDASALLLCASLRDSNTRSRSDSAGDACSGRMHREGEGKKKCEAIQLSYFTIGQHIIDTKSRRQGEREMRVIMIGGRLVGGWME